MRPLLHFTAETGWINDPHGITFHDGGYHLFHQYVPDSLVWAPNCHWGHATSPTCCPGELPVAIAPGEGDDGIWTGSWSPTRRGGPRSSTPRRGSPNRYRTRPGRERRSTTAGSSGRRVTSSRRSPGLDLIAFRDPFVVREATGGGCSSAPARPGDAIALTYTSDDLGAGTYEGIAARSTNETATRLDGSAVGVPADLRGRRPARHGLLGLGRRRTPLRGLRHRHLPRRHLRRQTGGG